MQNGKPPSPGAPTLSHPAHIVVLSMLNATLTAQIGALISLEVPATDTMNVLAEHLGQLLSLVEPMQLRNSILAEIRQNLPGVVNRHFEARMTTAGGVRLVEPGARVQ
jgi:hypothetical protein